jgi:chromate reductase
MNDSASAPLPVLALSGSLRRASFNTALLAAAQRASGTLQLTRFDYLAAVPMFDADVEAAGEPEAVGALRAALGRSDGLLLACPEYNAGPSGAMKNAIDWLSRPPARMLRGMAVGMIGASPGASGTVRAQAQLRQSLSSAGALVLPAPDFSLAHAAERLGGGGRLLRAEDEAALTAYLARFAEWVRFARTLRSGTPS